MTLAAGVLAGDSRAIARALSLVENAGPEAADLLSELRPHAGRAVRIGLTGAPGAGKSTLAERLVTEYRRRGFRVAVLAVDPSSPFTGGAILGDRVRMQAHAQDAGVFIRSMATRGQLGGLAAATSAAADVLAGAGFQIVIVETVGVGQAEVEIVRMADVTLVIAAPGAGDDVQALKAGIMEIGDIYVVNKADREGADRAAGAIEAMLGLQDRDERTWRPPVLKTIATSGDGVAALVDVVDRFIAERGATIAERRARRETGRDMPQAAAPVIDHIGVAVRDAEPFAAMLYALFGLETGAPETLGVHLLRFADTGTSAVELVQPLTADSPVSKFLAARDAVLHHVCLRVPDIEASLAQLKSLGIRLIDDVPRAGAHGSRIAFLHPASTGGILFELKEASQPEAGAR
jgi:LAO/AO transport system kinase